jgi:hypothetical protein
VRPLSIWQCVVIASILAACGRPVVYPRSAEIREGLTVRARSNVSHGDATVGFEVPDDYVPNPGQPTAAEIESTEYEGHASSATHSYNTALRLIGVIFNLEGELGYAPIDGIQANVWVGLQATGVEVRAQPLSERIGAPFSASLSVGALTPSLIGSDGVGIRFGMDLSRRIGRTQLLLGGYGSWEPRQRNMKSEEFPDDGDGHIYPGEVFGVTVVRNEWKLSIPAALQIDPLSNLGAMVGVVPEFTLSAELTEGECEKVCGPGQLSSFEQSFALYFIVGFEFGARQREP